MDYTVFATENARREFTPTIRYHLPDQRVVAIPFDVCRAAATLEYTLADGRIVTAIIVRGER